MEFDVILPIAIQDYHLAKVSIPHILECFAPKQVVIIGTSAIEDRLETDFPNDQNNHFQDENLLLEGLTFSSIRSILAEKRAEARTGWYFQQFLKMAYATKTESDYYLSWDADTIPLRKISFFSPAGNPLFATKNEYHVPYFQTMERLLGLHKCIKKSFIAEHMMFSRTRMLELLSTIEARFQKPWYSAILECVDSQNLTHAGFSEFETYGTYVATLYPDQYQYRDLEMLRLGKRIFGDCPDPAVLQWLGKEYDSISFEKWDQPLLHTRCYTHAAFRKLVTPRIFVKACSVYLRLSKKS